MTYSKERSFIRAVCAFTFALTTLAVNSELSVNAAETDLAGIGAGGASSLDDELGEKSTPIIDDFETENKPESTSEESNSNNYNCVYEEYNDIVNDADIDFFLATSGDIAYSESNEAVALEDSAEELAEKNYNEVDACSNIDPGIFDEILLEIESGESDNEEDTADTPEVPDQSDNEEDAPDTPEIPDQSDKEGDFSNTPKIPDHSDSEEDTPDIPDKFEKDSKELITMSEIKLPILPYTPEIFLPDNLSILDKVIVRVISTMPSIMVVDKETLLPIDVPDISFDEEVTEESTPSFIFIDEIDEYKPKKEEIVTFDDSGSPLGELTYDDGDDSCMDVENPKMGGTEKHFIVLGMTASMAISAMMISLMNWKEKRESRANHPT